MQACLPGKPECELQAVDTALWRAQRIIAYVSGNVLIILRDLHHFHQTIVHGESDRLRAVAIDPATGKIATSSGSAVHIHQPLQEFGDLRWALQHIYAPDDIDNITCLSWGLPGEVLIGGSKLALLTTDDDIRVNWKSPALANSCRYDRLVKVWRRGFIGGDNERFDPVYLAHPATVTSLRWRGRPPTEEHAEVVLYTTCADGHLRIWTSPEPHCLHILDVWAELDLNSCIQPRSPLSPSPWKKRYTVMVDKWDFQNVVEHATRTNNGADEREQHTIRHLQELSSQDPEVCIVLDDAGNMSAWGLERVGCKARFGPSVMNIGHAEDFGLVIPAASTDFAIFRAFVSPLADGSLTLLAHLFDGRLQWLSSRIEQLFDPSLHQSRIRVDAEFTGHTRSVQRLLADDSRQFFVSQAEGGELTFWRRHEESTAGIVRQCGLTLRYSCLDIQMLHQGQLAIFLQQHQISCWNLQGSKAFQVACVPFRSNSGCRLTALSQEAPNETHLQVVDSKLEACSLTISVQRDGVAINCGATAKVGDTEPMANGVPNGLAYSQNDRTPCSSIHVVGENVLAISSSSGEVLYSHWQSATESEQRKWVQTVKLCLDYTCLVCVACSPVHVISVDASRTKLTIWNILTGLCEYQHTFSTHESVESASWCTLHEQQQALTVVLTHRVMIFLQASYDCILDQSLWVLVKELDMLGYTTLPITDVLWTAKEMLVVSAGSQLFAFNTACECALESIWPFASALPVKTPQTLRTLSFLANRTLPVFHPQSLVQQLFCGQLTSVQDVLSELRERLKYWVEGEVLESSLNSDRSQEKQATCFNADSDGAALETAFQGLNHSQDEVDALIDNLRTSQLPWISATEQSYLRSFCGCMGALSTHKKSIDAAGLIYLSSLYIGMDPSLTFGMSPWRSTVFALLSVSQDNLLDITMAQESGTSFPWAKARKHQTCLWILSRDTLCAHFELVARAEYTKAEDRDPLDCSLYYLALRKKSVLQGLWRMAHGHREREQTMRVLAQDFEEQRWKSAALKNAYALLGKQRAMYAAAWFLLAGEATSAVNVLAGDEVADLELAISVARVFDGDDGPVLKAVIEQYLLPQALQEGDKWKAVYGFLMLKREDLALQACVRPLHEVIKGANEAELPIDARMWWKADPAILTVYRQLRDQWSKSRSRRNHAFPVSLREETNAVRAAARTYMRMGCGWLALNVLRTWEFSHPVRSLTRQQPLAFTDGIGNVLGRETKNKHGPESTQTAPSMLDGFESKPSTPVPEPSTSRKKVTEESSASSILDNFDF
ncbi:MAG: hypothetical protein Q9162_000446 [Coniocarpon cinnabarinum]